MSIWCGRPRRRPYRTTMHNPLIRRTGQHRRQRRLAIGDRSASRNVGGATVRHPLPPIGAGALHVGHRQQPALDDIFAARRVKGHAANCLILIGHQCPRPAPVDAIGILSARIDDDKIE